RAGLLPSLHGRLRLLQEQGPQARPASPRARPDARRLRVREPVRVLAALQGGARGGARRGQDRGGARLGDPGRLLPRRARGAVLQLGRVGDATFAALRAELSDEEILELTYVIGLYFMHAVMTRALKLEFDDVSERIVEVPAPSHGAAGRDFMGGVGREAR